MSNGNGKWVHYLVSVLVVILLTATTTLAKGVIDNDRRREERDRGHDMEIASLRTHVEGINVKLNYITDDIREQKIERKEMLELLKKIDNE